MNPVDSLISINRDQAIDLYKTILAQETADYSTIVTILISAFALLIGLNLIWNSFTANRLIEQTVQRLFEEREKEFLGKVKKAVKDALDLEIESTNNRLTAIQLDADRGIAKALELSNDKGISAHYHALVIKGAMELKDDKLLRSWCENLIELLLDGTVKEIQSLDNIKEIVKGLPDVLSREKKQLTDLLAKCKELQ